MAKADAWMPLYVADYLRDTMHLSTELHGAYMLLLMACWTRGGRLPDDSSQLAGIARMPLPAWKRAAPVLLRFFASEGGELTHKRVTAEFEKAQRLSAVRRETGSKGGRPRKQSESSEKPIAIANGNQSGSQTETPSPSPTPDGVKKDADASSVGSAASAPTGRAKGEPWLKDADFLAAWSACTEQGRTRSSRKLAWAAWKLNPAEPSAKLAALKAYLAKDPDVKRTGGPGFHLWLRDKLDEWLQAPSAEPIAPVTVWPGPPDLRAAIVAKMDEAWTRSWLDPCDWDEDGRAILAPRDFTVRQLEQNVRKQLVDARVNSVRVKGRAA